MTIYVVHEPRAGSKYAAYDLAAQTAPFGKIKYVFDVRKRPTDEADDCGYHAQQALKTFSDDDFLLWLGGDPVGLALCAMIAARQNQGAVKMLRWVEEHNGKDKPKNGRYKVVQLYIGE